MDGMGWDVSLTPPTTRAPLAVLKIEKGKFVLKSEKLKVKKFNIA